MKKLLLIFSLCFVPALCLAQLNPQLEQPIYQARTLNAFSVYNVTDFTRHASSATSCICSITASSISFISTGGLHAGATRFMLANYTIKQLVDALNALPADTVGIEGGLAVEFSTGCYISDTCERLDVNVGGQSILGVSAKKVITQGDTNGISVTIPAQRNRKNHLVSGLCNMTFTSGSPAIYVYDGSLNTATVLDRESFGLSGIDATMSLSPIGYLTNKYDNTAMLFSVYNSTNITAGWVVLQYFKE